MAHPANRGPLGASAAARRVANARRGQASLEREILAERAESLRRAGDRLQEALESRALLVEVGLATADQLEAALADVADAAWSLIVQRECAGFRMDNLAWIRAEYDLPPEVLRRV